jgi:hypothetical protein
MSNSSNNFSSSIKNLLRLLSGRKPAEPPPGSSVPSVPPDSTTEPAQIVTSRVMMIIYDPIVDTAGNLKLSQKMSWNRPEDLSTAFISDILETSGGLARYQIVQRIEVNEFPAKTDGFLYTPAAFMNVLSGGASPHIPETADYQAILMRFDIIQKIANGEIDEVWIFAFPHAGFYESIMDGPGAFWCNSKPLADTSGSPRRFVVMGFSLERGVGEMLESFGHRAESIMEKVFARSAGSDNLWQRFTRYDKIAPGQSEVGTVHFAPNSERDYDWGNQRFVASHCDDWYKFPNFTGVVRQVNCAEWGNGDIRAHHKWWLKHFPKVAGRKNGIANSWWQYVVDPNRVQV